MKTRTQFIADQPGIDSATKKRKIEGGWIVKHFEKVFDNTWLNGVYHYSFEFTWTDICNDLPGNLTIS